MPMAEPIEIPMVCAYCKKTYGKIIIEYEISITPAVSHGICDVCFKCVDEYGELSDKRKKEIEDGKC